MSIYSAGAKIGSNLMKNFGHAGMSVAEDLGMTAEREGSRILRGAFSSAAKKTGLKPQSVRTNKTAIQDIISQNAGRPGSYAAPPFKPSGTGRPAPGTNRMAARNAELGMKRTTSAAKAAVTQQNAMDVAKSSGQITDREIVKQNKILNARRRTAVKFTAPNAKIMSTNPSGGGAKASTLGGRSWMWNIGTKIK
jgi:hypothetical protein